MSPLGHFERWNIPGMNMAKRAMRGAQWRKSPECLTAELIEVLGYDIDCCATRCCEEKEKSMNVPLGFGTEIDHVSGVGCLCFRISTDQCFPIQDFETS